LLRKKAMIFGKWTQTRQKLKKTTSQLNN